MFGHLTVSVLVLFFVLHLYVNVRLSSDILGWVPAPRKRNALLGLVWLLPVAGALYVYRRLAPEWFTPDGNSGAGQSGAAAGLLGLDAIFNPGSRHIADAQKKGEITVEAERAIQDRELPAFIEVSVAESREKDLPT